MINPNLSSSGFTPALNDLRWLMRYAEHCGFCTGETTSLLHALRTTFGPSAWRIICRSPKDCFIPILRNQELTIHSLIAYCKLLAKRSFVQAPKPILLAYYVRQRRLYFDRPARIPRTEDYDLIRVANRHDRLKLRDIAAVANWAHQSRTCILPSHRWESLVQRAYKHFECERIQLASANSEQWHFFCSSTAWRGYQVDPITDAAALWREGQHQGNCLYRARFDCTANKPSRFFKISKAGRSIATLELVWKPPEEGFRGMDLVWGRWDMQDLRLSYNRLPNQHMVEAMLAFASMYNFWSKRLKRMPPGYVQETLNRIKRAKRMEVWNLFISEEQTPA